MNDSVKDPAWRKLRTDVTVTLNNLLGDFGTNARNA
jgi:hypothetical protein